MDPATKRTLLFLIGCMGSPDAWKVLAVDVTIGFGSWVNHRIL